MAVDFFTRNIGYFTEDHIFHGIILELFKDFKELSWLAYVDALHPPCDLHNNRPGWTGRLAASQHIKPHPQKRKYLELEKILNAVVLFTMMYDGRMEAYELFIKPQRDHEHIAYLPFADFKRLSELARRTTQDKFTKKQAIRALIVFSGLCRTCEVRERAKHFNLNIFDPELLLEALMQQPDAVIKQIIPSYQNLLPETVALMKKASQISFMPFRRLYYLEGREELFEAFETGFKTQKIDFEAVCAAFIVEICFVAAKKTYISSLGSFSLQQSNFAIYWKLLKLMEELYYDYQPRTRAVQAIS